MRKTVLALALLLSPAAAVPAQEKAKPGKVAIDSDQNYLVLTTKRIQTVEKETAAASVARPAAQE